MSKSKVSKILDKFMEIVRDKPKCGIPTAPKSLDGMYYLDLKNLDQLQVFLITIRSVMVVFNQITSIT